MTHKITIEINMDRGETEWQAVDNIHNLLNYVTAFKIIKVEKFKGE